jgi:hypothetical protein
MHAFRASATNAIVKGIFVGIGRMSQNNDLSRRQDTLNKTTDEYGVRFMRLFK